MMALLPFRFIGKPQQADQVKRRPASVWLLGAAPLLLTLSAFPALAQAPSAETEAAAAGQAAPLDEITVSGERSTRPERSAVSGQARAIAAPIGSKRRNPMARFEKPVCPGVMGLPEDWAEELVGRVRYVAGEVGLRLAPENTCQVNALIAFVPDSGEGMRQVERALPELFQRLSLHEKREIMAGTGPVQVVTATLERTRDGFAIPDRKNMADPPVVNVPLAFSHIFLTTREDIEGVVLLFETRAVDGMSIVQLADYAAMRAFAETRPPREEVLAMDSILTLFESGVSAPQSLTDFDFAYLRSLYDGIPNMPATTRLLGVNRQLSRMEKAADKERELLAQPLPAERQRVSSEAGN